MQTYNPYDHYWLRADGSLYASGRGGDISAEAAGSDPSYQSWLADGGVPTQYPRDEAGAESRAELVAVLAAYGLRVYPLGLDEVRAEVVAAINAAFEGACAALLADEPPSATATYAVQQAEAEAYAADSAAPTPMLDMLSAARGLDKVELVRRVLVKAGLYAQASGLLLGQQQRLMDDVAAIMAADLAEELKIVALQELVVAIGLPGVPGVPGGGEG